MSNDQSPPARKVIPYKKDGRRQSPFSEMAFQFSGTALDVAIQQREQDSVVLPPEISAAQGTPIVFTPIDTSISEAEQSQSAIPESAKTLQVSTDKDEDIHSPPLIIDRPEINENRSSPRSVRFVVGENSKLTDPMGLHSDLQSFLDRWRPFLTDTQLGICAYIYNNSTAINHSHCFTSIAKIMAAVSKTERQVKTVLNQLLEWEFIVKGETVINAPREKRGTYYKLNPAK